MSLTKRLCLIAGAAVSLAGAASAQSTLDQSRAYAAQLAADAQGRTSSLAQRGQDFTVNVHGYEQFRYNWNHRDDEALDKENTIGFQNARTRVNLSGNIGTENWGYFIQFGTGDPESGSLFLEDAYGTYKMEGGWNLRFGQFKLPLYREELVGDTYQLFADRSVTNSAFSQMRSQGLQFEYEADTFRFYGAFSDGLRTANTDFNSASEADWALTARGEFKWNGAWRQANDFTSFQNSDYFGMVGVAAHWQSGGDTGAGTFGTTTDVDVWALTADVSVEGNGWNAFGAILWQHVDPSTGTDFDDWAVQLQGGIFLNAQWELVGGFDIVLPDGDRSGDDEFSTIRVGFNHYFIPESHAAKLTIDLSYFLDNPSNSEIVPTSTLTGLLPTDEDSQFNLRGQIQLLF
jgi:hypothetical protein